MHQRTSNRSGERGSECSIVTAVLYSGGWCGISKVYELRKRRAIDLNRWRSRSECDLLTIEVLSLGDDQSRLTAHVGWNRKPSVDVRDSGVARWGDAVCQLRELSVGVSVLL